MTVLKNGLILSSGLMATALLTGCAATPSDAVLCGINKKSLANAVLVDGGKIIQKEVLFVLDQIESVCDR